MRQILLAAACLSVLSGCAVTPTVRSWRPWMQQFMNSVELPPPGSSIEVRVTTDAGAEPPAGHVLRNGSIEELLRSQLQRRGYLTDTAQTQFVLEVRVDTRVFERDQWSMGTVSMTATDVATYGYGAAAVTGSAVAVALASQVNATTSTRQSSSMYASTDRVFEHSLALELRDVEQDASGPVIWQGYADWESRYPDSFPGLRVASKMLFARLPRDPEIHPEVPRIKSTHEKIYYAVECQTRWFSAPALPYRISFPGVTTTTKSKGRGSTWGGGKSARSPKREKGTIESPFALAAYVDLVQNAELAFPMGSRDWSDPFELELWKRVRIGGAYRIGSDPGLTHVLVDLKGWSEGYSVESARVVSKEEFEEFQASLWSWMSTLDEYMAYYVP